MQTLVLCARFVVREAEAAVIRDGAVAIRGERVLGCGQRAEILATHAGARVEELGDAIVVPGLINAHQHGRGVSQLLLGYPDDALECWIAGRRRHGPPDTYALVRYAAEQMLAAGVSATLHANYSYGTGDYERELRETIRAYRDAGLRATICIGVQDRGVLVYPDGDEAAFLAGLPDPVRRLVGAPARPAYMADLAATTDLMERILADHAGEPGLRFAYGPAGPQWVRDETWAELARHARAHDVGLHFHLLESPAQAAACRTLYPEGTLRRLDALGVLDAPASCAHAVFASPEDLEIAARRGLVIVTNPGSNMRLRNGPPPVEAFLACGAELALGTDNTALSDDEDYLRELRLGGLLAGSEAAGARSARMLAVATRGGAAAAFLEKDAGRLVAGAIADLAAFELANLAGGAEPPQGDPIALLLARGRAADCILTIVGGEVRYRRSPADEERLAATRRAALAAIDERSLAAEAATVRALQEALRGHYAAQIAALAGERPCV